MIPIPHKSLPRPIINRITERPAHITADHTSPPTKFPQRPRNILRREQPLLPIRDRFRFDQCIHINTDINRHPPHRPRKSPKPLPPIAPVHTVKPLRHPRRLTFRPRMNLQPPQLHRPAIPKPPRRPSQLKIPASPNARLRNPLAFQRPINPPTARPSRRSNIPIRMIIKSHQHDIFVPRSREHTSKPPSRQMMKIPRPIKNKQLASNFPPKLRKSPLQHPPRRRIPKPRPPLQRRHLPHPQPTNIPRIIQIHMHTHPPIVPQHKQRNQNKFEFRHFSQFLRNVRFQTP